MTALSPEDTAYLAGLFDGEGHISDEHIELCMTDIEPLVWVATTTGIGKVTRGHEARPNRRQPWHWRSTRFDEAADLLDQMRPYLKVKWAQAQAFIILARLKSARAWKYGPPVYREDLVRKIIKTAKRDPEKAYEEALDLAIYLKGALVERDLARAAEAAVEAPR